MKNSDISTYKLTRGLVALTLLAAAAGCGDDVWDEPVGEDEADLCIIGVFGSCTQAPDGDVTYSITFDQPMSVQLFVRNDGDSQFLIENLVGSVGDEDGTITYSLTDSASNYEVGEEIEVRFAVFSPDTGQQFVPGPDDSVWSEPFTVSDMSAL